MQRKALVFGAGLLLAIASIVPAQAALAAPTVPSPRSVSVTGDPGGGDGATVHWSPPSLPRGTSLSGYTVTISPAERQPNHGVDRLSARTTSDRFGYLTAGTTYSFAVRAVTNRGTSAAVTVSYTRPGAHVESLYALSSTGSIVSTPVAGGAVTTVATGIASFDADQAGNVYAIPTAGTSIVKYPTAGGSPSTVVSGLSGVSHLQIDTAGRFYVDKAGSVERIAATNGRVTTTVLGPSGKLRDVSGAGLVTTATQSITSYSITFAQYPAAGGAAMSWTLGGYPGIARMAADAQGNVYADIVSGGASGAVFWERITPGQTTLNGDSSLGVVTYDAAALAANGDFSLLEAAKWCNAPSTYPPPVGIGCVPDYSLASVWKRTAAGTVTSTPATGFQLGGEAGPQPVSLGASSLAGDVFVDVSAGPSVGLWKVPAAGGTATQIATGQYTNLVVG